GHPLGASGAIEAAICALGIRRGWAPGTVNLERLGPAVGGRESGVWGESGGQACALSIAAPRWERRARLRLLSARWQFAGVGRRGRSTSSGWIRQWEGGRAACGERVEGRRVRSRSRPPAGSVGRD